MKLRGVLFLLKVGDGGNPETFTTIAGQRSTSATLGNEQINVTDKHDSRWKKLIEGGVRGLQIACKGLIQDVESFDLIRQLSSSGEIRNYQIVYLNGVILQGPFQIDMLDVGGEYSDSQQYDLSLTGAREIITASETTPGELLIMVSGTPLLLTEGGDPFFLIEEVVTPYVDDASGTELVLDESPDETNLAFSADPVSGEPVATPLSDFAITLGAVPRGVYRYVTPGVFTFDKPAGAKFIEVVVVGGAGGGGSGVTSTSSGAGAGAGGGGGARVTRRYVASEVPDSVTVTVGAGGNGGAAVTNSGSVGGAHGLTGSNSSFGALLVGYSGGGGCAGLIGGSASGGGGGGGKDSAGGSSTSATAGTAGSFGGGIGGSGAGGAGGDSTAFAGAAGGGAAASNANGANGGRSMTGGQGGGAGGGAGSALRTGGSGGVFNGTANAGGAVVAQDGGSLFPAFAHSQCGSGGGGGANSINVASGPAGDGGHGQQPGGGGGGGGSAFGTGTKISGAGGNGGAGCVLIFVDF